MRNGNIAACSKHSRRLPGYRHNHRHMQEYQGRVRAAALFVYLNCYYLFGYLFVSYNCLFCCFFLYIYISFITFMPFAFSYPIIFCAYRLSTSIPQDNRCVLTGIKFCKTYARTSFELTLTCLVLARVIFSRKKRCILWPFKLTSDLFLLVNSIRNWGILRPASCGFAHLSADRVDQVQTIRQMSSVSLWEAVQRVLKATFEIFLYLKTLP